jgi:hypothetical protein
LSSFGLAASTAPARPLRARAADAAVAVRAGPPLAPAPAGAGWAGVGEGRPLPEGGVGGPRRSTGAVGLARRANGGTVGDVADEAAATGPAVAPVGA